ncbi:MAG: sialidase family protein [Planctomycetales bacterium]
MRLFAEIIFSLLVLSLGAATLPAADDIQFERVFGPELPGKYKHPANFTQLSNGDLYLVYYGGAGEYEQDTAVYGARKPAGCCYWTCPEVIADTPFRSDGNGVIWEAPDHVVWLFYVVRYGETWSDSMIKFKVSYDGARTWTESDMLSFNRGDMVRGRPILLNDGDYLLPVYNETGKDREVVGPDTASFFIRYVVKEKKWVPTNHVKSRLGNLQPSVVQIDDNYLIAYCRRGGDYKGKDDSWLVRTESRDGGRTWAPGTESKFPNPNAATDFIKLKNGHLLLVYNNDKLERMPLDVSISVDNDKSYPYHRVILNNPGNTAAYPAALQTQDGMIHLIYTSDHRSIIHHAWFDESAILNPAK